MLLKLTVAIMAAGWRPGNITDWGAIACVIIIITSAINIIVAIIIIIIKGNSMIKLPTIMAMSKKC